MQRKSLHLATSLTLAALLSGCAAQANTPSGTAIPQALIEAAKQASEARLVYADLLARQHGYSVESVRLDGPDAGVPAFMRANVRLDYDGPMGQVLQRVANDIGYRINEYAKTASGVSWTPWVRLSGSKPLLDHFREMNTQVPWHLVLDHRNHRLVVDYSAEGGMAEQIRSANQAYQDGTGWGSATLPDAEALAEHAEQSVQQSLTASPAQSPEPAGPSLPYMRNSEPTRQPKAEPAPVVDRSVWYAGIPGYDTHENAQAMVAWLGEQQIPASIEPYGAGYEVRVVPGSNDATNQMRERLKAMGVPTRLGVQSSDTLVAQAGSAIDASRPAELQEAPQYISNVTSDHAVTQRNHASTSATRHRAATPASNVSPDAGWGIQVLAGTNENGLNREKNALDSLGYANYIVDTGRLKALRAGPFERESQARQALKVLREGPYKDAYLVRPERS